MDKHFLEFWGNLLINTAKGQRQMEDMAKWMTQGLKGFEDLTSMFRKFYGLDRLSEGSPDYQEMWKKAEKDFQKSFQDYLNLFGVVSKQEHLALVRKYEELKNKVADQEETIRHYRMLLDEKGMYQGEVVKGFQQLVKRQTEHFEEFMKGFGKSIVKQPTNDED